MLSKLFKNRLFVFISLLLISGVLFVANYKPDNRLACQKEVTSFDKVTENIEKLLLAQKSIKNGNYSLKGELRYSKYMPSDLNGSTTTDQVDKQFEEKIGFASTPDQPLLLDYKLIENDKYDPNKKNPGKKPFSGYILVSFKYEKSEVYRIQIDYLEKHTEDLETRINCLIDAFLSQ